MAAHAHPLMVARLPFTGIPKIGFSIDGRFVVDPYRSFDGRHSVNPLSFYGLDDSSCKRLVELNERLDALMQEALEAGIRSIEVRALLRFESLSEDFLSTEQGRLRLKEELARGLVYGFYRTI